MSNTSRAPESSAHGPAVTSVPAACSSVNRARCAGRAASRRGSSSKVSSTVIMTGTLGGGPRAALYRVILLIVLADVPLLATLGPDRLARLAAVHETEDGRRRRLGEFAAPCAVDKTAVLDGGGHTATWLTSARSRLRFVPAAEFRALVDVASVRDHVLAHLAGQLRDRQDGLVLGLAETLGLTRVSVNRALRTLAGEGLVRVEPGAVVVLAPELLTLRAR